MKRLSSEDIIDLEIFIKSDESESEAFKEARDFRIYASATPEDKAGELPLLKHWIEQMRKLRGGHCAGAAAEAVFKALAAILFLVGALLIGAPLANAFFVGAEGGELINVSYFFFTCVFIPFALFLSAIFLAPTLGLWLDYLVSGILGKFFKFSGGIRALYSANKKWILLKGALTAQYFGLGIACGILFTQIFKPVFNEYEYGWSTTLPNYATPGAVYKAVRAVSLPWALFAGAEVGYPSLKQVEDSLIKTSPGGAKIKPAQEAKGGEQKAESEAKQEAKVEPAQKAEGKVKQEAKQEAKSESAQGGQGAESESAQVEKVEQVGRGAQGKQGLKVERGADAKAGAQGAEGSPRYEAWAVFFILSCLFYGVFARLCVLLYLKVKISKTFGIYRIKNDRKISEIIRRMSYSSLDSTLDAASSLQGASNATALLLRSDMRPWSESILKSVREALSVPSADIAEYSFGRELFSSDMAGRIEGKKNLAFVYLADDYNEEVFENIENLVNRYPDKFISVHLLGKLSKADAKFLPPLPVDKSWWERKVNSISSRNIKLF